MKKLSVYNGTRVPAYMTSCGLDPQQEKERGSLTAAAGSMARFFCFRHPLHHVN
jgi:hypothetical protein